MELLRNMWLQKLYKVSAYLEAHKGDLHRKNGAQAVNSTVGYIDSVRKTAC